MTEPWFKKAFEGHYTEVYAHRNEQEALQHCPQIIQLAQLQGCQGWVLDLGCGQGRYSHLLQKAGYKVASLDYSRDLLIKAQQIHPEGRWLRGNMLNLPFKNVFARVLSLFTSFGYFDDDQQNIQVLREMAQSLKPGGLLYLDYLNPQQVKESDWTVQTQGIYTITSKKNIDINLNMVHKDVRVMSGKKPISEYQERVKLYGVSWFEGQAQGLGMTLEELFGEYQGGTYLNHSPRQIMVFRKL